MMFDAAVKNVLGHVHRGGYEFAVRGNIKRGGTVKIGTAYPWKKRHIWKEPFLRNCLLVRREAARFALSSHGGM
jgi:hypothetical protein